MSNALNKEGIEITEAEFNIRLAPEQQTRVKYKDKWIIYKRWDCKHIETGKIFFMERDDLICASSSIDYQRFVSYQDDKNVFIIEYIEFYTKFKLIKNI